MYEPSPSPPMNVARNVEIASVVDPNTSPSSRVHKLSRIRPDDPDRKKQASRTARIGERTLYDRRRAPGYSSMAEVRRLSRLAPVRDARAGVRKRRACRRLEA